MGLRPHHKENTPFISVWCTIDAVTAANGALRVLPFDRNLSTTQPPRRVGGGAAAGNAASIASAASAGARFAIAKTSKVRPITSVSFKSASTSLCCSSHRRNSATSRSGPLER